MAQASMQNKLVSLEQLTPMLQYGDYWVLYMLKHEVPFSLTIVYLGKDIYLHQTNLKIFQAYNLQTCWYLQVVKIDESDEVDRCSTNPLSLVNPSMSKVICNSFSRKSTSSVLPHLCTLSRRVVLGCPILTSSNQNENPPIYTTF